MKKDTGTGHLFDNDGQPTYHVTDPWTSKAAGKAIALKAGALIASVAIALAERHRAHAADPDVIPVGFTAYELAQYFNKYATDPGTRIIELRRRGFATYALDADGKRVRRPTDTGSPAEVHVLTEAGLAEVAALGVAFARNAAQRPSGTMKAAGRSIHRTPSRYGLTSLEDRILEELYIVGATGATDTELAELVGDLRTSIGGKRKALAERGDVLTTSRTRKTPSNRAALVHIITDKGTRVLLARTRPESVAS